MSKKSLIIKIVLIVIVYIFGMYYVFSYTTSGENALSIEQETVLIACGMAIGALAISIRKEIEPKRKITRFILTYLGVVSLVGGIISLLALMFFPSFFS